MNIVSEDHVRKGVRGGFTQADHGREDKLKSLSYGDVIVFYSPRTLFRKGRPLQEFTAIGVVEDDAPFQFEISHQSKPWRRRLSFLDSTNASILPLIQDLSFIADKENWGLPFKLGLFEIEAADFQRIAAAMGVSQDDAPKDSPEPGASVREA